MVLRPQTVASQSDAPARLVVHSQQSAVFPPPVRLGLRLNFAWAVAGNLIYQGTQWLNLVVLAKFLSAAEVGRFALALAICTPLTVFSALNLTAIQVTDTHDEHRLGHFLSVQLVMSSVAFLLITLIVLLSDYEAQTKWVIVVVGFGQAVIAVRETVLAYGQKQERMDRIAISKAIIGVTSLGALLAGIWSTGSLLVGVTALQGAKVFGLLAWDLPATARLIRACTGEDPLDHLRPRWGGRTSFKLIVLALPLGLSGVLASVYYNVPRYYLVAFLDENSLGYFAAIMALVMAGVPVTQAAGMSALPRLSRYYIENRRAYLRLLIKLTMLGATLGAGGVVLASISGPQLLSFFFTEEYAAYHQLFVWSMVFGTFVYIVTFWGVGMTAMRKFRVQPLVYGAALAVTGISGWILIPQYGLWGAALCLMAGKFVQGAGTVAVLVWGLATPPTVGRASTV